MRLKTRFGHQLINVVEWEADTPQLQPKANEGLYSVG